MAEKGTTNDGFGPLGICHRLFNFIMNSFLTRGNRRLTSGTSNAASPHDDGSRPLLNTRGQDHVIRPDGHEISVEYRHTNGAMVSRTKNNSGQVLVKENTNMTQAHNKTEGNKNGGREKETNKSTLTIVEGEHLPGRKHHLLDVTTNINEKADAFIRSRKEAMERALSMKQ
ncbi:hypothetical protein CTI12_AA393140 [Artemisia annua]|uniref:Uncharacterized protein n=1 Tax=Artemisia annua TaxID=35608 RepID=A0A2U1MDA6_ARTAN|nr:hypothetical protein CTI12_AA393140 [Artemisia annua]